MFASRSLLMVFVFAAGAFAQQCQPSTGILKLTGMDPNCATSGSVIQECTSKMQLTTSQACTILLQPDLPVAADGTFCSPSQGVQQRDVAGGKLVIGRSDIEFLMRPHAASGSVMMSLKGRIVPPTGGREYPVDCQMVFNVTGGSALGIVSTGTDSLMATTVTGPAVAGGGYSGAALPGQQNGVMGPQAESGNQQPAAKKSSAETRASSTVVKMMAGLTGLLLPALL